MKSKSERIDWQKRTKTEHQDRIITLLKERGTMRFKDFEAEKDKTGVRSAKGITEVLNRLMNEEKLIEKTHISVEQGEPKIGLRGEVQKTNVKRKQVEAYRLTKKGEKYEAWWLIHELLELQGQQASYAHSGSSTYYESGLSDDIIMTRGGIQLDLLMPPVPQIEDFIMEKLGENIRKQKAKIESTKGKLILSFEFDYEKLSKALIDLQNEEEVKK